MAAYLGSMLCSIGGHGPGRLRAGDAVVHGSPWRIAIGGWIDRVGLGLSSSLFPAPLSASACEEAAETPFVGLRTPSQAPPHRPDNNESPESL